MLLMVFFRVSWLSLMFFSTASCYPAGQVFDYSQARSWSSGVDTDQQPLVLPTRRQQHAEDPHGPPSSAVSPPWSPGHGAFNHPQARSWFSGGTNSPSDGLSQPGSAVGQNPPPAVFYLPGVPSKGVGQVQPPPSPGKTPEVQSGSTSNEGSPGVPQPADSASVYVGYNYGSHYAAAPDGGQPEPDAAENTDSAEPASPEVQQPQDEGGAGVVDVNSWFLSRPFPDFTVWDSSPVGAAEFVSETSPPLPSSYIIQSNSGYQRLREFLSHTKYTPDYYIPVDSEPPVLPPADPSSKATPDVKGTP